MSSVLRRAWRYFGKRSVQSSTENLGLQALGIPLPEELDSKLGLIAGYGPLPLEFCRSARERNHQVVVVAHRDETEVEIEKLADSVCWIKVGELGKLISTFVNNGVRQVALVGGIRRVRLFGNVKLDTRGAMLLTRLGSTKDDRIMRGVAAELASEGIQVIPSVMFMAESLAPLGVLTHSAPTTEEEEDIRIGVEAIKAMSGQDIGQLVVVREGVVVAVEAVEGSDKTILRGGELGGPGSVIVKFAKATQDMRFDVPTVGEQTIAIMQQVRARVLAIEAGRCLIVNREQVVRQANLAGMAIIGCPPLTTAACGVSSSPQTIKSG